MCKKMLSAKHLWRLHMVSLDGNASIRAFGDPLVRARKAGRLMINKIQNMNGKEGNESKHKLKDEWFVLNVGN